MEKPPEDHWPSGGFSAVGVCEGSVRIPHALRRGGIGSRPGGVQGLGVPWDRRPCAGTEPIALKEISFQGFGSILPKIPRTAGAVRRRVTQ